MSYAKKHLMSGETIERETHLHWLIFTPALLLGALTIFLFAEVYAGDEATRKAMPVPEVFLVLTLLMTVALMIKRNASEFVVTNKRVLVKTGLLTRRSTEILLRQIEGITVDQGLMGRLFGYGTLVIEGTGSDRTPYKGIAGPQAFHLAVQEQIERCLATPAVPIASATAKDPYGELLKLNELREKGALTQEEFDAEKRKILG